MACQELADEFATAMNAYDESVAFTQTQADNLQQAQWAEQARMWTAMTLAVLLQACLNGNGGMGMTMAVKDAFSSPETLKAKISELRQLRKKVNK